MFGEILHTENLLHEYIVCQVFSLSKFHFIKFESYNNDFQIAKAYVIRKKKKRTKTSR